MDDATRSLAGMLHATGVTVVVLAAIGFALRAVVYWREVRR